MTGSLPPWGGGWETNLPFLISEPDRRCHPERARGTRVSEGSGMRARGTPAKQRIWHGEHAKRARAKDLENLPDGAGEAGHYVAPVEALVRGQDLFRAIVAIDTGHAPAGVQDPDESGPGGEPVGDLRQDLAGTIAGRHHLDDQVGGEMRESRRLGIRDSVSPDERNVRTPNGVRITRELEPRFRVNPPQPGLPHVRAEPEGEIHRHPSVPEPGQLPDDQHAFDELYLLVWNVDLEQLVRGHQGGGGHVGNVGRLGGHGKRICAGASTRDQRPNPRRAFVRQCHMLTMIEITSIFTSQSPAWIAATFHGTFSQIIDPVSRITGNPIHRKRPRWTAPMVGRNR